MDITYLTTRRDQLIEELERQKHEFWPANIVQVLELERIMETLDRLTMELPNFEDLSDVNGHDSYRWGTESPCSE